MAGGPSGAQLYLVTEAGPATAGRLAACLAAVDVATVLLLPVAGRASEPAELKALVEAVQAKGVAALVADDAKLARTLRADGVHLTAGAGLAARYAEAREILGTRYIVGADAGLSRHDAMTVGEAGADYVAFSLPAQAGEAEEAAEIDLLDWWSEIFEVPSVAFGPTSPEDARVAADAGADFVAVRLVEGASAADAAETITAYAAALGAANAEAVSS